MCDYLKRNWYTIIYNGLYVLLLGGVLFFIYYILVVLDVIKEIYPDQAFNYTIGLLAIMLATMSLTFNTISNLREMKHQEANRIEKKIKYLKIQIQNIYCPVNSLLKNIENENCIKIINENDAKELKKHYYIVDFKEQEKIDSLIEILKKDRLSMEDKKNLQNYKSFFEDRNEKTEKMYKNAMRELQRSLDI